MISEFINNSKDRYNRSVAKKYGLTASIVLENFCYLATRNNNLFPYLIPDIAKDAFIHKQTATKTVSLLVNNGVLKRKRRGIPSKIWYSINEQALNGFITKGVEQ